MFLPSVEGIIKKPGPPTTSPQVIMYDADNIWDDSPPKKVTVAAPPSNATGGTLECCSSPQSSIWHTSPLEPDNNSSFFRPPQQQDITSEYDYVHGDIVIPPTAGGVVHHHVVSSSPNSMATSNCGGTCVREGVGEVAVLLSIPQPSMVTLSTPRTTTATHSAGRSGWMVGSLSDPKKQISNFFETHRKKYQTAPSSDSKARHSRDLGRKKSVTSGNELVNRSVDESSSLSSFKSPRPLAPSWSSCSSSVQLSEDKHIASVQPMKTMASRPPLKMSLSASQVPSPSYMNDFRMMKPRFSRSYSANQSVKPRQTDPLAAYIRGCPANRRVSDDELVPDSARQLQKRHSNVSSGGAPVTARSKSSNIARNPLFNWIMKTNIVTHFCVGGSATTTPAATPANGATSSSGGAHSSSKFHSPLSLAQPSRSWKLSLQETAQLQSLAELTAVPFDETNLQHVTLLNQYWKEVFYNSGDSVPPIPDPRWKAAGFQSSCPYTDFRGGGLCSLECMVYLASKFRSRFASILADVYPGTKPGEVPPIESLTEGKMAYPFSAAFINIAFLMYCKLLRCPLEMKASFVRQYVAGRHPNNNYHYHPSTSGNPSKKHVVATPSSAPASPSSTEASSLSSIASRKASRNYKCYRRIAKSFLHMASVHGDDYFVFKNIVALGCLRLHREWLRSANKVSLLGFGQAIERTLERMENALNAEPWSLTEFSAFILNDCSATPFISSRSLDNNNNNNTDMHSQ